MTLGMKKIVRSTFRVLSGLVRKYASKNPSRFVRMTPSTVNRVVNQKASRNLSSLVKMVTKLSKPTKSILLDTPFQFVKE